MDISLGAQYKTRIQISLEPFRYLRTVTRVLRILANYASQIRNKMLPNIVAEESSGHADKRLILRIILYIINKTSKQENK